MTVFSEAFNANAHIRPLYAADKKAQEVFKLGPSAIYR